MLLLSRAFATVLVLLLVACGGASASPPVSSDDGPTGTPSSDLQPSPPAQSATDGNPLGAATGNARIGITNLTGQTLFTFRDAQTFPAWLHVGSPELQLTAYGSSFCGTGPTSHNDPVFHRVAIAPGERSEYVWSPIAFERNAAEGCWQSRYLPPGVYPGRACFYRGEPPANFWPGQDAGVPETCTSFSVTVTASDETAIEVSVP